MPSFGFESSEVVVEVEEAGVMVGDGFGVVDDEDDESFVNAVVDMVKLKTTVMKKGNR